MIILEKRYLICFLAYLAAKLHQYSDLNLTLRKTLLMHKHLRESRLTKIEDLLDNLDLLL